MYTHRPLWNAVQWAIPNGNSQEVCCFEVFALDLPAVVIVVVIVVVVVVVVVVVTQRPFCLRTTRDLLCT